MAEARDAGGAGVASAGSGSERQRAHHRISMSPFYSCVRSLPLPARFLAQAPALALPPQIL